MFKHWYIKGENSEEPYNFNQSVNENIDLVASFDRAKLVIFSSEGTPVVPQVIQRDTVVQLPDPTLMIRPGYQFKFWSKQPNGEVYVPQIESESFTLYAIWESQKTQYSIIYWIEKPNIIGTPQFPDDYMYAYSGRHEDYTGTQTTINQSNAGGFLPNQEAINYITKYFDFYQVNNQEVKGDGSTVVNVYYNRKIYDITFNFGDNMKSWRLFNDTEDRHESTYVTKVKLGQQLKTIWPETIELHDVSRPFSLWSGYYHYNMLNHVYLSEQNIGPLEQRNWQLNASYGRSPDYVYRIYYLECLYNIVPVGEENATLMFADGFVAPKYDVVNGVVYELNLDYTSSYQQTATTSLYNSWPGSSIPGFSYTSNPGISNYRKPPVDLNKTTDINQKIYYLPYYYDRNSNDIILNALSGSINDEKVYAITDIKYMQNVSNDFLKIVPTPPENMRFIGWGINQDLQDVVDIDDYAQYTMPAQNLIFYAKYQPVGTKVSFYQSLTGKLLAEKTTVRGGLIEEYMPYELDQLYPGLGSFKGWYFNVDGYEVPFPFEMAINDSIDVYAKWDPNTYQVTYYVPDYDGNYSVYTKQSVKPSITKNTLAKNGYRLPKIHEIPGQVFKGWYRDINNHESWFNTAVPLTDNIDVYAIYETKKFFVTPSVINGTITPNQPQEVAYDGTITISFRPNDNYELDYVQIDGIKTQGIDHQYTFKNIKQDHSIVVAYKPIEENVMPVEPPNTSTKDIMRPWLLLSAGLLWFLSHVIKSKKESMK